MKIVQKIGVGIATGALFVSLATNVFASTTTVTITANGQGSHNHSTISNHTSSHFTQTNKTKVITFVGQDASTGDNSSSSNVGGTTNITSGDTSNSTTVDVTGGDNSGTAPTCCCNSEGNTSVTISNNGENSHNSSTVKNSCHQSVKQTNKTTVITGVEQSASTGGNTVSGNTGGSNTITSGDATNTVEVTVTGGNNTTGPIL